MNTSKWNDGQKSRDRIAVAVLVTEDGTIFPFTGKTIEGVAVSRQTAYCKNGKWSNADYEISHRETTTFIAWHEDFETGRRFPQPSFASALTWLRSFAPQASEESFRAYCADKIPKRLAIWDADATALASL